MLTSHNRVLLMLLSNIYNEYSKHQEERIEEEKKKKN